MWLSFTWQETRCCVNSAWNVMWPSLLWQQEAKKKGSHAGRELCGEDRTGLVASHWGHHTAVFSVGYQHKPMLMSMLSSSKEEIVVIIVCKVLHWPNLQTKRQFFWSMDISGLSSLWWGAYTQLGSTDKGPNYSWNWDWVPSWTRSRHFWTFSPMPSRRLVLIVQMPAVPEIWGIGSFQAFRLRPNKRPNIMTSS